MKIKVLITVSFLLLLTVIISSCKSQKQKDVEEGENLAHTFCVSCHQYPEPELLDKKTWTDNVLPEMAKLMHVENMYNPMAVRNNNTNPSEQQKPFPYKDWLKIVSYYNQKGGDSPLLRKDLPNAIDTVLNAFTVHEFTKIVNYPVTTMVSINAKNKNTYFADGVSNKLFTINNYKIVDSIKTESAVTSLHVGSLKYLLSMGILKPSDEKLGKLSAINANKKSTLVLDSLRRPVHTNFADLDGDGKEDIVVCEFGYTVGDLSWFKNTGKGYEKNILRLKPGATKTELIDFNNDGKLDIVAMLSQSDEGIFLYTNKGNGKFEESKLLGFPPSYGSNYFQFCDFNKDGYKDIIATCGDNGDYSIILKPYHGIRIYLNDKQDKFTEYQFLPVHGAQKAIPADFDGDGDLDIASIAFFPDYENHPYESFIYWENNGDNTFKQFSFSKSLHGRWITMDVADADGDGDMDIVLGNAFFTLGNIPKKVKEVWSKKLVSTTMLENKWKNLK